MTLRHYVRIVGDGPARPPACPVDRNPMNHARPRALVLSVLALLASTLAVTGVATPAQADGPGVGTPWVVTLGDSYISGEAGRWAGSSNASSARADALGGTAYFDNATNTAETINRCHRSKSAEAYIGGGVSGMNFACSGSRVATFTDSSGNFKPGLDFYNSGGQPGPGADAAELRRHPQREDGDGLDRRQRLQLRLHRPDVRHQLARRRRPGRRTTATTTPR